ncbi:MAG: DUF4255 domain-containing protein [Chloroflexi bacterium]|nr:DUF4255 domain-containing protein [Chloroflexota bacterium]
MTLDAQGRDELNDLDEALRQILIQVGDLRPSEVDIDFSIPDRDWSGGITRPTINCYLFNIHERKLLREDGWQLEGRGGVGAVRRPPPLYIELTYLITAWTQRGNVADEHRLLWRVLRTLARFPMLHEPVRPAPPGAPPRVALPEDASRDALRARLRACLPASLHDHPLPIYAAVAQPEGVLKSPGEFWSTFENPIKPSLTYAVTIGLDREALPAGPPVLATGLSLQTPETTVEAGFQISRIVTLPPDVSPAGLEVTLPETGYRTTADEHGWFRFSDDLPPGRYQIQVKAGNRTLVRSIIVRDPRAPKFSTGYSAVVRDQRGAPLAGITVTVTGTPLRAVTDADGHFSLDLPPGRHALMIQHEGWIERREVFVRESGYGFALNYGGLAPGDS